MIHEDQDQMCSSISSIVGDHDNGGNCVRSSTSSTLSSKKLKQRKVPQRGLGVAQLEKIRIEEQQQKDPNFSPPPLDSPTQNGNNKSKSSVPYSPPSPPPPPPPPPPVPEFPSSSPLYRTHSMPNIENFHMDSLPPLNPPKGGGFSIGWPSIPNNHTNNVNVPKYNWHHHELHSNQNGENSPFLRDLSLPFETCSIAPLPDVLPKAQHYQHQPSSPSLVNNNISSSTNLMNISSSSSVINFTMAPPSNQNYFSNYSPSWSDDQKVMFGMKRPCPFPLEDPPIPIFRTNFTPINTTSLIQTEESTSLSRIPILKDFTSRSSSVTHEPNTSLRKKSNEELLIPGNTSSLFSNTMVLSSQKKQVCNFKALPYQVSFNDSLIDSRHNGSNQQPKYISFFPSTKLQATPGASEAPSTHNNSCNCEVGENIDLNLSL